MFSSQYLPDSLLVRSGRTSQKVTLHSVPQIRSVRMGVMCEIKTFNVILLIAAVVTCLQIDQVLGQNYCVTPNDAQGICIPISECSELLNTLKAKNRSAAQTKFLRDSQCGEVTVNTKKQPKVCCKEECGQQLHSDRILGGEIAALDQFPWMALIEYRTKKNTKQLACGGTLVNDRYVITAAHCVFPEYTKQIGTPESIRLGEFNKTTPIDCITSIGEDDCNDPPVIINIEQITIHPQYNPTTGQKNDIALIRLAEKVSYTDFIKPICLPRLDVEATGNKNKMTVAGWGATETGRNSEVKLYIELNTVPIQQCQNAYGSVLTETLWNKQICAGGERGKDSCRGDSGGPLMSHLDEIWTLHGVVSFGPTPCASENIPGVYTKVFSYMPWIRENMKV